ncbi:hypothetical protein ACJX0J_018774 [Zea mays]
MYLPFVRNRWDIFLNKQGEVSLLETFQMMHDLSQHENLINGFFLCIFCSKYDKPISKIIISINRLVIRWHNLLMERWAYSDADYGHTQGDKDVEEPRRHLNYANYELLSRTYEVSEEDVMGRYGLIKIFIIELVLKVHFLPIRFCCCCMVVGRVKAWADEDVEDILMQSKTKIHSSFMFGLEKLEYILHHIQIKKIEEMLFLVENLILTYSRFLIRRTPP